MFVLPGRGSFLEPTPCAVAPDLREFSQIFHQFSGPSAHEKYTC
nr:MAG TPA: hypothetical protein [Caudoviricetes sp.]